MTKGGIMDNEAPEHLPKPGTQRTELLPAMLAIALAVAAQLALQDGLTLLGLAGYVVSAWLFVTSVRPIFDAEPLDEAPPVAASVQPAETEVTISEESSGMARLNFLRRHWRQVTIAEIVTGDIPPARLADLVSGPRSGTDAPGAATPEDSTVEAVVAAGLAASQPEAAPADPAPLTAQMESWTAAGVASSSPKAVKVTPQGEVLVLDTGAGQVQRFDEKGNLLATYAVSGLAGVKAVDLDVSPDGQTLYIVDATSGRLQVIDLAGRGLVGEAGGADEEE
jgi:DNA-binding beta-propeller fold protein YncE